jgi:hypothetical protein
MNDSRIYGRGSDLAAEYRAKFRHLETGILKGGADPRRPSYALGL